MKVDDFVRRADELLARAERVAATIQEGESDSWVDAGQFAGLRAAILSFLAKIFGERHPYYSEVAKIDNSYKIDFDTAREVLIAAKDEVAGGWLHTTKGLVAAEIFSDFLDMANHLLTQGYKDAAAVIAGSVLEEHLRQLATASEIEIAIDKDGALVPKKADRLNADLVRAGTYSALDQQNVTTRLVLSSPHCGGLFPSCSHDRAGNALT